MGQSLPTDIPIGNGAGEVTARAAATLVDGLAVSILPVRGGRLLLGRVVTEHPQEPVVQLDIGLAGLGDSTPVWVTSRDPSSQGLRVHEAVAGEVLGGRGLVRLAQVRLVADEPRRSHLRAASRRTALLVEPGRSSRPTTTIDLSAAGCRVAMPVGQTLTRGQAVQVALDVDHGDTVWVDGEVVRVDDDHREAALRFTRVDPGDSERLTRRLLSALLPPDMF